MNTSALISRRTALLGSAGTMLAGSLSLAGCGGGSVAGAQLRAINLATDLPSVDLFTDDTLQFGALAVEALPDYRGLETRQTTLRVKKAGDGATLLSDSYTPGKGQHATAVIWGREAALRLSTLPENEDNNAIAAGSARVRLLNATADGGAVDMFLTSASAELGDAAPTQGAVAAGDLSGFREVSAGTYRLRVTGAGDPGDLRLDVAGVALTAKQHYSLVLTAGSGGVLLNGVLIQQQAGAAVLRNTQARVRLVCGVDNAGVVAVTIPGSSSPKDGVLAGGRRSPSLGPYQLVDAGSRAVEVRVNGVAVSGDSRSFAAGADYTLLVTGPLASPIVRLIVDDNRLPVLDTRARIRVVHGVNGVEPITLSVDFLALATDVPLGAASAYANTATGSAVRIDLTTPTAAAPLYERDEIILQGQSVYTVFLLGGNASPQGTINKER